MTAHETARFDVHRAVTDAIVAALEKGAATYECPWHRQGALGNPTNAATGNPYHGVNVIALWAAAMLSGYSSNLWATFLQWQNLGAKVRRGERSSMIVFYKKLPYDVEDPRTGEKREFTRLLARASRVFNADQVEAFAPPQRPPRDLVERSDAAEQFVRGVGADIRFGGSEAFYSITGDYIAMPPSSSFTGSTTSTATESYYSVLLHELVHWTGAKHRLDRELSNRFGGKSYAMEELVAEVGAAFLCANLEIASTPRPDHAAYVRSWLEVLKADKRAIFTAASQASEAADYLTCV